MLAKRKQRFSFDRTLILVLVIALIIRLVYLWIYNSLPDWDQLTIDNNYHHHWAQNIAEGNIFGDTTYFRAPFYVYCLAFLYAIFGSSLWVGRLFGLVIGLASVGMTYALGKKLFNRKTAVMAALVHALYPMMIYFESELLLDSLFLLLVQITLYQLLLWIEKRTTKQAFITGLFLGLAAITRPTILVLVPLLIIVVIAYRHKITGISRQLSLFAAGMIIIIGPIFLRNILIAGDPVLIASQGGINFYIGNNEVADGVSAIMPEPMGFNWRLHHISFIAEKAQDKKLKPGEISSYWTGRALDWIKRNPATFVKLYAKKLYYNFSNREISNNRDLNYFLNLIIIFKYNPLSFGLLFSLTIIALVAGVWKNKRMRLIIAFMLIYILAGALFFFNSRFRLPLLPYYFILAAYGLLQLLSVCRKYRKKCGMLLLAGLATAIISYYPLVKLPTGSSTYAMTSKGLYYYAKSNFAKALRYHRQALAIDSTYPEVNLNVGVDFLRLGEVDSARYYFEREQRFNPDRTNAITNLASLELLNGNYNRAILLARKAIAKLPYDIVSNAILLRALFAIDTLSEGVLMNEVAQAADRTDNDVYLLNDAALLLSNRNLYKEANIILRRALAAQPPPIEMDDEAFRHDFRNSHKNIRLQKAKAAYQLGYISGLTGEYEKSIRYSKQAIADNPDLAEAYLNLISGYLSIGERAKADSVINIASKRFSLNSRFIEMLNRMKR